MALIPFAENTSRRDRNRMERLHGRQARPAGTPKPDSLNRRLRPALSDLVLSPRLFLPEVSFTRLTCPHDFRGRYLTGFRHAEFPEPLLKDLAGPHGPLSSSRPGRKNECLGTRRVRHS